MREEGKFFRTFFYQGHQIRTVEHNGETWWVASDVCKVLEHSDTSVAVSRLDDDEKLIQTMFVSGQSRNMLCVNEPGLYRLISKNYSPYVVM
jgi:anti-repressor protein